MIDNKELKVCTSRLNCRVDILDGNGHVVGAGTVGCDVIDQMKIVVYLLLKANNGKML